MNAPDDTPPQPAAPDDPPPLLGRWRNLYVLVLGNLALLIVIFWALTRGFNVGEGP